jgi:ribosomal protein S18 acetylase RimI-like enzyme
MSITVREATTRSDLRKFIAFPFKVYEGNPYWVPPLLMDEFNTLDRKKNPSFEYCEATYWLAYKDGRIAGRIAGIINRRAIEKWGKPYGRFGWVDFIDDAEVAQALFDTMEAWLKSKGMVGVQGPLGFTDLDKEGLLIEGFEELGTMAMIYNHPYYPAYLERCGYSKDVDWIEFEVKTPASIPEKALRVQELVLKRQKLHLYPAKRSKDILKYGKQLFDVLNEAYAGLYNTVELSERQKDAYIKQYLGFVDIRFTKVILDENDTLVAFCVGMPSLSRALQKSKGRILPFGWVNLLAALRDPKYIDLYLIGIRTEYQSRGVPAILMTSLTASAIEAGIISAESAGELEDNTKVQSIWNDFEKRQHKRRRAYKKTF